MKSANQVLSKFIASGQVWYVGRPDKQPALLTDVAESDEGHDGVCLFLGRKEALSFLRASKVPPGQFRPWRGAPHPRRSESIGSFVRACRLYSPYLCLPWPVAGGRQFNLYFLEIKQLLAAARRAHVPDAPSHPLGDGPTDQVFRFVYNDQRLRFSDN
ncbi:MAG: hypothetical protein K2R98_12250 [Gemmataceae bacterium]|nr:hypothetical protein [Gemmataceae bacterium]